ncbi:MAG TPA: hopanoid biosynthesis-associated protein HpnK [Candidatus Acidoferrum sp.]|nr:hopanoid biosynthesis-associated protein HpnK [Candidatus Acidoferrum sp.]
MKRVILNADDFGLTRGVNEGIIRAHREGILTSATLMATGSAFDDAVERAKANPKLGIGCHLVLTGGVAVSPPEKIPSLAGRDGQLPKSLGAFVARVSTGQVRAQDMETELRAQIERIRRAGIEPSHVDTHKHTHVHPRVMSVLAHVAHDCGISRIRNPVENLEDSWRMTRGKGAGRIRDLAASAAVCSVALQFKSISSRYGLRSPDHFLGLAATGRLDPAALCDLLDTIPEGSTEIMLHPGLCDADLAATGSRLQEQRQTEMAALIASEVVRAAREKGIQLITYRELN